MAIIEIKNLVKNYGDQKVLKDISFNINPGEIVSIIGPSGSGKSTCLRCINHLESYQNGQILYENHDIDLKHFDINHYRSEVTMIFQNFNLFNHLSVIENCVIGQVEVLKRNKKEAIDIAYTNLKKVGLEDFTNKNVNQLSGGQQQRVAIARALSMNPKVLLLDEPTSALDPQMVDEVLEVIQDLATTGITMVIVTHEMRFARNISDQIIFMKDGNIIEQNDPQTLFTNPQQPETKAFLHQFIE